MKYGFKNDNGEIIVIAADTLQEFEEFTEGEAMDFFDKLGYTMLKNVKITPKIVSAETSDITVLASVTATDRYEAMMDRDELYRQEELGIVDRRPIAEVLGLDENDPWSKVSEEQLEANKQEAERMKKLRASGGLSGDSFGGDGDDSKVIVRGGTVVLDDDKNVVGVKMAAVKSMLQRYEIIVNGEYDFTQMLDSMRIPEDRVDEQDDNRLVVGLHSFQINIIDRHLTMDGHTFSINPIMEEIEGEIPNFVSGHADQQIFFVAVSTTPVTPSATSVLPLTSHMVDGHHWYVFARKSEAQAFLDDAGIVGDVLATNRKGIPIIAKGYDAQINDNNEAVEIGPREWNSKVSELHGMTDDERKECLDKISSDEFLYACEKSEIKGYRSVVYIVPASYFKEHNKLWEHELEVNRFLETNFLNYIDGCRYGSNYEPMKVRQIMSQKGFIESLKLHMFLNEL